MNGLVYEEKVGYGIGALVIKGIYLPNSREFDPLSKLWSSFRRRIIELYDVDAAGIFVYDDRNAVIYCSFCPNYTALEEKGKNIDDDATKEYIERYEKTFSKQMKMFREAIERFLLDPEYGFMAYDKLVENENASSDDYNALFNAFLKKVGVRTNEDEEKAKENAASGVKGSKR